MATSDIKSADERYVVTTVLDGNKRGLPLHSIYPSLNSSFVIALDSTKSNLVKLSLPLSQSKKTFNLVSQSMLSLHGKTNDSLVIVCYAVVGETRFVLTSSSFDVQVATLNWFPAPWKETVVIEMGAWTKPSLTIPRRLPLTMSATSTSQTLRTWLFARSAHQARFFHRW